MEGNNELCLPPEIIARVLQHLGLDRTTLRSALLVNKTWALEAIRVLWARPSVSALAGLEGIRDDRRQFYARQIRVLDFVFYEDIQKVDHAKFRDLKFSRLRIATIEYCRPKKGEKLWLGQYIQPSLEDFEFNGAEPAEDILHLLVTRCPRLRSIAIDYLFEGLNSSRLIEFLDGCKSLRDLSLPCLTDRMMSNIIDSKLLSYLARRRGLNRLLLGSCPTYEMLDGVFEGVERPFEDVRDSWINPLPHVRSLVRLQRLHFRCVNIGTWLSSDILALESLKNLRYLTIDQMSHPIVCPTLTDEEFISVFKNMSELEELIFEIECPLTIAAITSLGEHCPRLKAIQMPGAYDMNSWKNIARPIFPQLGTLMLGAAMDSELGSRPSQSMSTRARTVARLVAEQAPKLQALCLGFDKFSSEMIKAFFNIKYG